MKMKSFFSAAVVISISLLSAISCSKSGSSGNNYTTPPPPPADEIQIYNMKFTPATLTVKLGTTVKWKNEDGYAHTATSNDGTTFDTGNISGGATATYKTTTAGTFAYHCLIHGIAMSGTLVVNP